MYKFDIFNTENYFSDYERNKYEQLYKQVWVIYKEKIKFELS